MRRILAWLGIVLAVVLARGFDGLWVAFWYAGNRDLSFPVQVVLDAIGLGIGGLVAGRLALAFAGRPAAARAGMWVGIWLLATTAIDLIVGLANEPWWHEVVTALVMAPAAALGGGARLPRRARKQPPAPSPATADV